jgi:hypothetical protein
MSSALSRHPDDSATSPFSAVNLAGRGRKSALDDASCSVMKASVGPMLSMARSGSWPQSSPPGLSFGLPRPNFLVEELGRYHESMLSRALAGGSLVSPKSYTEARSDRVRERSGPDTVAAGHFLHRPRLTSRASARSGPPPMIATDEHRRMHETDRSSDASVRWPIRLLLPHVWDRAGEVQLRDLRHVLLLPVLQHAAASVARSGSRAMIVGAFRSIRRWE